MKILAIIGSIIGSLIALIISYLAVVVLSPFIRVRPQPIEGAPGDSPEEGSFEPLSFMVEGLTVRARLFLPANVETPRPCIIMSHGFGGTQDILLYRYVKRYREAGLAVLTYDYRYFGESAGEPRQSFHGDWQMADLEAAVRYVRGRREIDEDRIALWGTSAAGGYGLVAASRDKKIAAVVGQCPALDGRADSKKALERDGLVFYLKLFVHAQRDRGRGRLGLSPHMLPIVGKPGTTAMLTAPGAFEGYSKLAGPGFRNEVCPRLILMGHGPNPIDYAAEVECPVLLQICLEDNLLSPESYEKTAAILGERCELKKYPCGHFGIYEGEIFEQAVSDQIEFFKRCLL